VTSAEAAARGAASPLPQPIVDTLRELITRRRRVILVRGLLIAAAVAVAAILTVMAVDAVFTILSSAARWLLTGGIAGATAAAVAWFVLLPIMRLPGLARMARAVETHHPELAERISSAVELLTSSDSREVLGSEELIAQLTMEATEQVGVIKPRREVTLQPAKPALAAVLTAAAVLTLIWVVWPAQTSRLAIRAVAPFARVGNLGARHLEVSPGDTVLAIGDSLRVSAAVRNGGARAATLLREADGVETELEMTRLPEEGGGSSFTLTIPSGDSDFRYRVLAGGDALSPYYRVTVAPRPEVVRYDLRYEYPDYLELEPATEEDVAPDLEAPVGTTLILTAALSKPLATADLLVNGRPAPAAELGESEGVPTATWRIAVLPDTTGKWWLKMTDRYGLANNIEKHTIKAVPDAAPEDLILIEPASTYLTLQPTDSLPFAYTVKEDHGFSAAVLLVRVGSREDPPITIPLPEQEENGDWSGRADLDLAALSTGEARQVRVQVRVSDTLPSSLSGPQHAASETVMITLDKEARSYIDQYVDSKKAVIEKSLQEALKALTTAKEQTPVLLGSEFMVDMNKTTHAINVVNGQAYTAHAILRRVGEKEALPDFVEVAAGSLYAAEIFVTPAGEAMRMLRMSDEIEEKKGHARSADEFIGKAIEAVKELLDLLKSEAERVRKLRELIRDTHGLANQQKAILKETQNWGKAVESRKPQPGQPDWRLKQMRVSRKAIELGEKSKKFAKVLNPGPRIRAMDHQETRAPKKDGASKMPEEDKNWGKKPPGSANPVIVARGPAWAPGSKGPPTGRHGPKPPNMPPIEKVGEQFDKAAEKGKQAAEENQPQDSMQQALDALQKAREMLQPGQKKTTKSGKPSGKTSRGGAGGGVAGHIPDGIGSDDWLRLPSELRTRILESSKTLSPEEYRTLVRRYFHTLAQQGAEKK